MAKAVGRPTKYKEEYCEQIVEFMRDGSSKVQFCVSIDISYETFLRWKSEKPEFSESIKRADMACQAWWEEKGQKAVFGGVEGFNSTGFIFNMKNRFSDFYKDRHDVEHSGEVKIDKVVRKVID